MASIITAIMSRTTIPQTNFSAARMFSSFVTLFWTSFRTLSDTSLFFLVKVSSKIVLQYSHFTNTKPSLYTFLKGLLAKQLGQLLICIHLNISIYYLPF